MNSKSPSPRPLILVTPLWDAKLQSLWMIPGYLDGLRRAGADPIVLNLDSSPDYLDHLISLSDGILLTGGPDVSPLLYDESPRPLCGAACDVRDKLETHLLSAADQRDIPLLGICRGLQIMNVFFSGSLYQDLPSDSSSDICHRMTPPYDRHVHEVKITAGSLLHDVLGRDILGVNSYHHQGVKRVGAGLTVSAVASDGLVEALEHRGKTFMLGVQWHPEFMPDEPEQQWIFQSFVRAAAHKRSQSK